MKKRIALWMVVLLAAALLCGCSPARPSTLTGNHINLSYAGARDDGTHQYTSLVGELTWRADGVIELDGEAFAQVRGRSGVFTFDDGRVLTGSLDASGLLKEVTVEANTVIREEDYSRIEAALLVYQTEAALVRHRNTALVIVIAVLLVLAAAAVFAVKPVTAFAQNRGWLTGQKAGRVVFISRITGIALAIIAIAVILIAVF